MFCTKCGTKLDDGVKFCANCGTAVEVVPSAVKSKNLWQCYTGTFKKYAVFEGRARRREYWGFILFNLIFVFILGFIEGCIGLFPNTDNSVLAVFYGIAVLLPGIALGIRRMHDCDKSGWYIMIPIYNYIVLLFIAGTTGPNQFGPDPKQAIV